MKGILGKKVGMTRIFSSDGTAVPVTVIEAGPCPVVMIKSESSDGYNSVQLGYGRRKEKHTTRPMQGHFKRAGVEPLKILREFRNFPTDEIKVGDSITIDIFNEGDKLDVVGLSKGRGFAGVMKRHGFHGHKASHGTHESFRGAGSIGQCASPSRVFKGMKMAGHMGNSRIKIKNLPVVRLEKEKNLMMVKGSVPGPNGGYLIIYETNKR
ncbi:50S ribosomal protein L3 [bacterium]|nr:50S ribosomal protein L3 [FCB group bacterium]MBL7190940.1 50S ribosomal protein L3 [bacterium]